MDFKKELYVPIRSSALNSRHEIILPHEKSSEQLDSKKVIPTCDLVMVEMSLPSTGVGIEMGWADGAGVKILGLYKTGSKISGSVKVVCKDFIEYEDSETMVKKIEQYLKKRI